MPTANTRLVDRMNRDKERVRAMQKPTIDSWQQTHTVCCVTPLVSMLRTGTWQVSEHGSPPPDLEALSDAIDEATKCTECDGEGEVWERGDSDSNGWNECPECGGDEHQGEVFEYWVVDGYLGGCLRGQGESLFAADAIGIVGDLVWCRTTSGQLIAADACVERAYRAAMEERV